ncbi:MAG: GLUG motif-containing protein [Clostridia bacterium]
MKSITHENRRRFTIITIVSVLFVAILTTTLVLLLKKDTTAPTNTIEVGKRIDTRLGGGRKLLNASVWDGSSATKWTNGSGNKADPYLIESAANLAYLRDRTNEGGRAYSGAYFLQTVNIDLNNIYWDPIGNVENPFSERYDGGNYIIANVSCEVFGVADYNFVLKNINVIYSSTRKVAGGTFGGLVKLSYGGEISCCKVSKLSVEVSLDDEGFCLGGLIGAAYNATIQDCIVEDIDININIIDRGLDTPPLEIGGVFGIVESNALTNIIASGDITVVYSNQYRYSYSYVGGIAAKATLGTRSNGSSGSNLISSVNISASNDECYIGGIFAILWNEDVGDKSYVSLTACQYGGTMTIANTNSFACGGFIGLSRDTHIWIDQCSFDGEIYCYCVTPFSSYDLISCFVGAFHGPGVIANCTVNGSVTVVNSNIAVDAFIADFVSYADNTVSDSNQMGLAIKNIIINTKFNCEKVSYMGIPGGSFTLVELLNLKSFYYNNTLSGFDGWTEYKGLTSDQMRERSSFDEMGDFDEHFVYVNGLNNDFPIVKSLVKYAQVTGFDGGGTQADPYQIKTTADLQGMQAYYNAYGMIDEYWWILVNDIDISTDANDLTINWTPIGYEGGVGSCFNGHFDGDGKTISGLTITEQYENVGLFGRLASYATITNLNVSGTINWDQAKYVGGVVGFIEDGATLTNCTFTGTITGYLNSGNYAIVGGLAGKYSMDAITGSANYDTYVYGTNNYIAFSRYTTNYAKV